MNLEICILAGGLSTRMGRDKSRLRVGNRTMLSIVRDLARELGVPVRVVRRDIVPRCGPLGGILTALRTTRAESVLFLACDMPLVSATLLRRVTRGSAKGTRAVFILHGRRVGFPFLLPREALPVVEAQISEKNFSIHALACVLRGGRLRTRARSPELLNVNTEAEMERVRQLLRGCGVRPQ
jgi:molybdopterin-guanine dinucleotide biosynthesis protein A